MGIATLLLALLNFGSGQENINEVIASGPKPMNWMKSAQNILAGPAGQMMVQFAKELISRSSGSSQVRIMCDVLAGSIAKADADQSILL